MKIKTQELLKLRAQLSSDSRTQAAAQAETINFHANILYLQTETNDFLVKVSFSYKIVRLRFSKTTRIWQQTGVGNSQNVTSMAACLITCTTSRIAQSSGGDQRRPN